MLNVSRNTAKGWLAFELNILRRLKYKTALLPFCSDPALGAYLKRWNSRVLSNDFSKSAWIKSVAVIENNSEFLTEESVSEILNDAYVPHYRLQNEALRNWFNETDSWWFDNVRQNIEHISSPTARAIAKTIAMGVGDYVLSFEPDTLELRQPLSTVFRRLWSVIPEPVNNGAENKCSNIIADDFIAENQADLMFLKLPPAHIQSPRHFMAWTAWREEWLRGNDRFWDEFEHKQVGKIGDSIETKSQYLELLKTTLNKAMHISQWAIAHVDEGFISSQEIAEVIGSVRNVDTIYTKDFTELTGMKAVIITA